jgi:lipid II:glycine glycyltransferase (peptidoglycan interpeptide bridge formation enzyme)
MASSRVGVTLSNNWRAATASGRALALPAMVELEQGVPAAGWDDWLTAHGGHVLQSRAWARFQDALGHRVLHCAGDSWSWLGTMEKLHGIHHLYVPYGPTLGDDDIAGLTGALSEGGRRGGADFVRVEPVGTGAGAWLDSAKLTATTPTQPRDTWILDLSPDVETLRGGLEKGHRWRVNAAERKGVAVSESRDPGDIETFLTLLRDTTEHGGFRAQQDHHYRTLMRVLGVDGHARLYVARFEGRSVAASIVLDFAGTRYYLHSAADQVVNRRVGAAVPLLWTMIIDAKQLGARIFDFWGVAPDDCPNHPWAGISAFKRAFGGRILRRDGTWDMPLRHLRYRAYRAARSVLRR